MPPVTEDMYNTSRDSSVRDEEIYLRIILNIPPVERITSSRERRIISENMSIGQHYPHEGIYPQGTSTSNKRDPPDDSSDDNRSHRGQR